MSTFSPNHIATTIADFAVRYSPAEFIANKVAPVKLVNHLSDTYPIYNRVDAATVPDDAMGSVSEPNEAQYSTSTDTFKCKLRGLKSLVGLIDEQNADEPLTPFTDAARDIAQKLLLARELRVANVAMAAANYASSNKVTLGTPWTNKSTGTPVDDINTGIRAAAAPVTHLILDEISWHALRVHPQIITTLRNSGNGVAGQASEAEVAAYFGLQAVVVGRAKYNTANKGQPSSLSYIWPQGKALLARIPENPGTKEAMLMRTFRFKHAIPGGIEGLKVELAGMSGAGMDITDGVLATTWLDPSRGLPAVRGVKIGFADDEKLVAADCGYLISSAA